MAFSSDDCREFVLGPTPFPLFAWPDPAGFLAAIPTARGFGPVFEDGFSDLPAGEFPASPVDCPPVPKVGPAEPVEFPDGDAEVKSPESLAPCLPLFDFDAFFFSTGVWRLFFVDRLSVEFESSDDDEAPPASAIEVPFPDFAASLADRTGACCKLKHSAKTPSNVKAAGPRKRKPAIDSLPEVESKASDQKPRTNQLVYPV